MDITPEHLSEVIAMIYAAVRNPEQFTPVLRRIRELVNGTSGMLFTPLRDPGAGGFGFVDHFDAALFQQYCAHYRALDPWSREGERKSLVRTGATVTGEMLISDRELHKEAFFHDAMVPIDVVRVCCSIVMGDEDASLPRTYLSIFRGVGGKPFGEEERRFLHLLAPHVLQALRLAYRLRFAEVARASAADALHALECGVVLLDARRNVIFMNAAAERLCAQGRGLKVAKDAQGECVLQASVGREDAALQQAVDAALRIVSADSAAAPRAPGAPVSVHGPHGTGPLLITVVPLSERVWQAGPRRARAALFLEDSRQGRLAGAPLSRMLFLAFRLTPAEARVAQALLEGQRPKVIADRLAVSESTVRTHIKALYQKTETRGIAALIALLSRFADIRMPAASAIEQVAV